MSLQVYILLPSGIFYNENITEIIRTTTIGQLGILKGHIPFVTIIEIRPVIFRRVSDWITMVLLGGIAFILNNRATIIVNSAEMAYLIKQNQIEKSFEAAHNRLNRTIDVQEKMQAINDFRYERARYETIRWQNLIHY